MTKDYLTRSTLDGSKATNLSEFGENKSFEAIVDGVLGRTRARTPN